MTLGSRRGFRRLATLVWGATLASSSADAAGRSLDRTPVYVEATACTAADVDRVVPLLRVELGSRLLGAPAPTAIRVGLECSDDEVAVSVVAPGPPPRTERIDLAASPASVRPRIVALKMAELVRNLGDSPADTTDIAKTIPPRPSSFVPEAPSLAPTERASGAVELDVFAQASRFRRDGRWLWGGGLRFDYRYHWLSLGFDTALAMREDDAELGTSRVWLTHVAPHVAWSATEGPATVRLGVGYALGIARISGRAANARAMAGTVTGVWAAPVAIAAVGCAITEALRLEVRTDVGWVVLPVVGEVARGTNVEIGGLWTNVQIGASLAL